MAGDPSYLAALDAALSKQDALREEPGSITFAQGTPRRGKSGQFDDTGALAGFRGEVEEHWESYFGPYRDKLLAFQDQGFDA
jgi:hypothetical protein